MNLKNIMVVMLAVFFVAACSSTNTSNDESTLDDMASNEEVTETTSDEEIEDFGSEEEADASTDEAAEDIASEDASSEDKIEETEETAEESNEKSVEDDFAEESTEAEESTTTEDVKTNQMSATDTNATKDAPNGVNRISAINYLDSANGGTIEIKSDNPAVYKVRQNSDANQIIIEMEDSYLPESLKRPFIMKEFEGLFGAINAYQNPGGSKARIVVQMKGTGFPVVTQEGTTLLVTSSGQSVAAAAEKAAPEVNTDNDSYNVEKASQNEKILGARTLDDFLTGGSEYFGRPISIQTNDAKVRDIINLIAEESGLNIVLADDVDGKISLKLRQVPWDQAFVIVMRSRGLGYVRQGNVIRVTKLSTLQNEARMAKDIVDSQSKLTPLKVKVVPVSYATVKDLETQVKNFLSERGKVAGDDRTSSLIITDTADVLARVERLIKELDIPPAQVMIEGKIVEATETFSQSIGVNWSMSGYPIEVSPTGGPNGTPVTSNLGFNSTSNANLAGSNGLLNFNIGTLDFVGSLTAQLGIAQADNTARIISSPRIVTMNKEKSEISQKGQIITIQTQAVAGSSSDAGNVITANATSTDIELKLEVTPQITADGSVILDVLVSRQFAGAEADSNTRARPVNTRKAKTKVLVSNGQTAVIGGIYQSDESSSETGVPGLKDIPVLGWLFKNKSQDRQKNELLIFLTPRILNAKDQAVTN
jgi:type IV pilus assembly protein PilQ